MTNIPIMIVDAGSCSAVTIPPDDPMRADAGHSPSVAVTKASPRIAGADPLVTASR